MACIYTVARKGVKKHRAKGGTYVGLPSRRRQRKSADCDRRRNGSAAAYSMEILLNVALPGGMSPADLGKSLLRWRPCGQRGTQPRQPSS